MRIVGFIVIVASAIISCLILIYANKYKKYSDMWDEKYGAFPEGLQYNVFDDENRYWVFQEDGTGILFYEGELPTEETTAWLKRGREKFKKSIIDEEMLAAAKFDYLVQKGYIFKGEEQAIFMFGTALFDNRDRFTEDELKTIHDQLAVAFYYCSMSPSERAE